MSRYQVNKIMRQIVLSPESAEAFKKDPATFIQGRDLTEQEREALVKLDYPTLYKLGAHHFLLNGFVMRVWPGDRKELLAEYSKKLAPHGYPDIAT